MMTSHFSFVFASYALTAVVLLGLVAWTLADYRAQRRAVAELESRGLTRRRGRG